MATPNPGLDAVAANCSITSQRVWSKSARQKKESGLTAARISTPSLDGRCHMMRYLSIQSHALMALSLSSCRYRIQCWLLAYYCDLLHPGRRRVNQWWLFSFTLRYESILEYIDWISMASVLSRCETAHVWVLQLPVSGSPNTQRWPTMTQKIDYRLETMRDR